MAGAAACGHKGPPQAPLRPIPAAASEVSIERDGAAVTVRFKIPEANQDQSTPAAVERVDVFALSRAADAQGPLPADLFVPANLVTSVAVRPKPDPDAPPSTDKRPVPGDVATVVDTIAAAATSASQVRYYAVLPAAGRRRATPSPILRVSLGAAPAAPTGVKLDYDEREIKATWVGATGQRFVVDETDAAGVAKKRLSAAPQEAATITIPLTLGQATCIVVRGVEIREAVSVIGAATAPVCVTPVDRFPPSAPSNLSAVPGDGGIELSWTASAAKDVAGYVILRGDGAGGTLQRLTQVPATGTAYNDSTARSGVTYVYAVVAIDAATPPNQSPESNREQVTARQPLRSSVR